MIEKGSAGFLGFGAKPAVIRARKKPEADEVEKIEKEILKSVSPKAVNDDIQAEKAPAKKEERTASPKPVKEEKKPAVSAPEKREAVSGENAPKSEKLRKAADPETVIRDAEKFLNDVFHAMGFTAEVKAEFRAEEKELAVLIWRRRSTAPAYPTSTQVSIRAMTWAFSSAREVRHWIPFSIW